MSLGGLKGDDVGLRPKVNTVMHKKDGDDDEVVEFAELARDKLCSSVLLNLCLWTEQIYGDRI